MPEYITEQYLDHRLTELEGNLEEKFVTKDEFHTRMYEVITILRRLDQERIFTVEWIRRIESDVTMLKRHLHLT